jgi:ABC-type sugar transport system permease subunit
VDKEMTIQVKEQPQKKHPRPLFRLNSRWQRYMTAYLMILPAFVLFVVFVIYPLLQGAWISLNRWDGLSEMKYIGFDNYKFVFKDKVFWQAMKNTFQFAIGVTIIKNILGLLLAVLLNKEIKGRTFFRASVFMPVTFSFVVIGILWSWIFNPTFGLLNSLLNFLHLGFLIQGWLSDPKIALWSVMWVDIWKWTGFHMVLLLAGLQSIPADIYEAAAIDGAGRWKTFIHITLPMLRSVLVVSVLMSLLGAFVSNYDVVYVMTGGGPFHATEVALTWIVSTTFRFAAVGKANAMSIILFFCVAIFGIMQIYFMTRGNDNE